MEEQIICLKQELNTIKKKKVKNSTIETKFHKLGNKISMLENSNEVNEGKVTKKNNILLSRDTTVSLPLGIVEYSDKNNTLLMIKSEEPPVQKNTENLKDDAVFLLNDEEQFKTDQQIEKIMWMVNIPQFDQRSC